MQEEVDFLAEQFRQLVARCFADRLDTRAALAEHDRLLAAACDHDLLADLDRAVGALRRLQLVGREMPLSGPDPSGRKIDVSTYRGKLLLVVFWASWSGEAVDDIPVLLGLHNQYRSKGFEIVGVSLDTQADSVPPFIKDRKIPWSNIYQPGVFDSPLAQQYGILTAPTMFLIGRDGKVISTGISISDLKDGLRKQLD